MGVNELLFSFNFSKIFSGILIYIWMFENYAQNHKVIQKFVLGLVEYYKK